jgi:hypothetical protein
MLTIDRHYRKGAADTMFRIKLGHSALATAVVLGALISGLTAQSLRMPFYYRAARPNFTPAAPTLAPVNGTEVSGSPAIDNNGAYSLSYSFTNSPAQISVIGGL